MILVMNLNFDHMWTPIRLLHGSVKWIFVGLIGRLSLKNVDFLVVQQLYFKVIPENSIIYFTSGSLKVGVTDNLRIDVLEILNVTNFSKSYWVGARNCYWMCIHKLQNCRWVVQGQVNNLCKQFLNMIILLESINWMLTGHCSWNCLHELDFTQTTQCSIATSVIDDISYPCPLYRL